MLIWVQFLFGLVCVEKCHPSGAKSGGTDGIGYLRVGLGANNKLICTVYSEFISKGHIGAKTEEEEKIVA